VLPARKAHHPDRDALTERYELFRSAS
jgi:hypothetical protein